MPKPFVVSEENLTYLEERAKEFPSESLWRRIGVLVAEVRRLRAKVAALEAGEPVMETVAPKVGDAVATRKGGFFYENIFD